MANRDIIVFDFETGSRNPNTTQPIQIAAVMIHGRKLTVQPNGYFESLIKPLGDEKAVAAVFSDELIASIDEEHSNYWRIIKNDAISTFPDKIKKFSSKAKSRIA